MGSKVKFGILNGIGSVIFTVYAILIHSYPAAVLNACLVADTGVEKHARYLKKWAFSSTNHLR